MDPTDRVARTTISATGSRQCYATRLIVLEKGEIHWQGTMAELSGNLEIQRAYLTV